MMYKLFFVLTLFLIIINELNAQNTVQIKDSLQYKMEFEKNDTIRVVAYYDYGDLYVGENNDSAFFYFDQGKQLAQKKENKYLEAFAHGYYIVPLNDRGKYKEALQICLDAEKLLIESNAKPKDFIRVYNNIANEWQYLGSFNNAAINYFKALKIAEKDNNKYLQSVLINNLSSLYAEIKDTAKQYEFAKKAKAIAIEINDTSRIFSSTINYAIANIVNKNYVVAKEEIEILYKIYTLTKEPEYLLDAEITNAEFLESTNNVMEAIIKYKNILQLCANKSNIEYELTATKKLGEIYLQLKQYNTAKTYTKQAIEYAKQVQALAEEVLCTKNLAVIEEKLGNAKNAVLAYKTYGILNDSLSLTTSKKETQKLQAEYDVEKKDVEIKTLTQKNSINSLQSKRRFWIILSLAIGILSLTAIMLTQLKNYKNKKALLQANQLIAINEERIRIATDMHDDVGTGISRIRYIAASIKNNTTNQEQGLEKISNLSEEAVQKMGEIIWSLNHDNQNIEELVYYIRGQVSEIMQNFNIDFEYKMPSTIPKLFFGWKRNRNTYLIIKEAVTNAAKHSNASKITIVILLNANLNITVMDNGNGFDTNAIQTKGNGLNNYKKRITELKGTMQIQSEIGKGTTLHFSIPI
jgi:two-component system, NarL family, sensor kinase